MRYITASDSTTGHRKVNQDRYAEFGMKGVKVMIVCDGNGGEGGEVVADCAMKSLKGEVLYGLSLIKKVSAKKLQHIGKDAIGKTAECINSLKYIIPKFGKCGTTVTLVFIFKSYVITFWVGDSPAYVYKRGRIIPLVNPPHTLAEKLIAEGIPRKSIEAQTSLSSTLVRCVGTPQANPSMSVMTFKPPFTVMVACDGIDNIPKCHLKDIFRTTPQTELLPGKIISSSLGHGSTDNITVVATKVKTQPKRKAKRKKITGKKRGGIRYV